MIAFLLAISASTSGCSLVNGYADTWRELSTGERVLHVAYGVAAVAVVATLVDANRGGRSVRIGASPEPCDGASCSGAPKIPCWSPTEDMPPGVHAQLSRRAARNSALGRFAAAGGLFLSCCWFALVELVVCTRRGHRWHFSPIGIARCRRCRRETIEGFDEEFAREWPWLRQERTE